MNVSLNQARFEEAVRLAVKKHDGQFYRDGDYFSQHLVPVLSTVIRFLDKSDKIVYYQVSAAAILHDIVEDTDVTIEQIREGYGKEIADLVWRLTDESGINRKKRKAATYPKIKENKYAVLIKLADRYINMQNSEKLDMYDSEWEDFYHSLHTEGEWEELWKMLDDIIHQYRYGEEAA